MDEQGAEIKEIPSVKVGKVDKLIGKIFGQSLPKEYDIPPILKQEIKVSPEISIFLSGPKENLQVSCKTATKTVLFNDLSPEGTSFVINDSKKAWWEADEEYSKVLIPSNLELLQRLPVYGLLHEISHIWIAQSPELIQEPNAAKAILGERIKEETPEFNLPRDRVEREKIINAWKAQALNEKKAAEIALYIIGKFRQSGVDLVPKHLDTLGLLNLVNPVLKADQKFDQKLTLKYEEAENLSNGNLPYAKLKERLDDRIAKILFTNSTSPS